MHIAAVLLSAMDSSYEQSYRLSPPVTARCAVDNMQLDRKLHADRVPVGRQAWMALGF